MDGTPIGNAQQILDDADPVFRAIAAQDGAPLPDGAGCWFAPAEDTAFAVPGPRVACGPVRLGIAADQETWLVGRVSYSGMPGDTMTGRLAALDAVAALKPASLNRPDGDRPPSVVPTIGTSGVRDADGRLLGNVEAFLVEADQAFAAAARGQEITTTADSRCALGIRQVDRAGVGIRQSTGRLWCGPARTRGAEPGAQWVPDALSVQAGDSLVRAVLAAPDLPGTLKAEQLPAAEQLYRPDGRVPDPAASALAAPPAAAQDPGYLALRDDVDVQGTTVPPTGQPSDPSPVRPTDGRLFTPGLRVTLTELRRAETVGTGESSVVAAAGEQIVAAALTATKVEGVTEASVGTVIVDGSRRPLPGWSAVLDATSLVVSVPAAARSVDLELTFDGRSQIVSLLTGERASQQGDAAVLYRSADTVGISRPVTASLDLPAGKPAVVELLAVQARLAGWLPGRGWAPIGKAFVVLTVDDVRRTTPCCDVQGVTVEPAYLLRTGQASAAPAAAQPGETVVTFLVDQDVTAATLEVRAAASWTANGTVKAGRAQGDPVSLAVGFAP